MAKAFVVWVRCTRCGEDYEDVFTQSELRKFTKKPGRQISVPELIQITSRVNPKNLERPLRLAWCKYCRGQEGYQGDEPLYR